MVVAVFLRFFLRSWLSLQSGSRLGVVKVLELNLIFFMLIPITQHCGFQDVLCPRHLTEIFWQVVLRALDRGAA